MNFFKRLRLHTRLLLRSKFVLISLILLLNLGLLLGIQIYRDPAFPGSLISSAAYEFGLHKHGPYYNDNVDDLKRYTFMGLLTLPTSEHDVYFNATRVLVYKLKHHPETKSKYPVHVLVMKGVDEWKIERLRLDGAEIIMVDQIKTEDLIESGLSIGMGSYRYQYMFTKLSVFEQTQFDKVCILDSDLLVLKNMDDIFDTPYVYESPAEPDMFSFPIFKKPDDEEDYQFSDNFDAYGAPRSEFYPYLLGACDDRNPGHATPPEESETFNAGLMLVHPSSLHMHRIKKIARYPYMYDDARMMEQSLLNLAYNKYGWFPWTRLDFSYNGVWVTEEDLPYLRAAHGKFWEYDNTEFPQILTAEWHKAFGELLAFHDYVVE
ncbi:alpha-1,3-galactosyltransferase Otg3 [Schizosaccharomyces pombe]|uniref:Uncharacterized protein C4C3.09 n=1 Tax=Schizosaccharomyces pombe (strain 972 / ATCC 24843) TaxID=284812 RepID=YGT9_SCHPO|nr:putative acetylglucosaminyltransferase [Schizosaccharomyces pombe]O43062.1 RecName: Full=Uncharacterized protein C4C3.09 [Schizosaccharomyces pombe 972h-]CAA16831.1 acetylglucosaminyltransferase (predicted) [Schizosaccharomyces pombe]|eukprot:NP_596296.1 putative acetylglucosaminyltransferase [Schizosaccharomyces pombe]